MLGPALDLPNIISALFVETGGESAQFRGVLQNSFSPSPDQTDASADEKNVRNNEDTARLKRNLSDHIDFSLMFLSRMPSQFFCQSTSWTWKIQAYKC